ncbi:MULTISPECIES: carbohydrate-binding protein [unclassified Vibrio]|uniref:carbohydrate-binding protein n=1 Tax=unclassified Vibrio TaxID=2614977 RepID=UPI000B8E7CAD|nr:MULTISPECIES: carbohydrate-binding protein [unclassified Vibrio]OXX72882.1 hypothetical protein B9J84_05525 [Vibrio sp. V03_P4A6T147]NAW91084.1 hypothetical protein [Vibrio sp. V24_P1S3T111]OXX19224.1 hypothetical protein B9J86_15935 [Vibrio sp. V06_P1A73T115]OXX25591.1 hypothetical protein B9J88_03615 [Vibrio sp. V05_P4A8T149]OXX29703.1 hypothetical protein B9J95_13020 [Vibrio sp. V14_P6S14T42]
MNKQLVALAIGLSLSTSALASVSWDKDTAYSTGDIVNHNGESFVASHWSQGTAPEVNDISWDGWIHLDSTNVAMYAHEQAYVGGSVVNYNGDVYLAKWWVKGEYPSESSTWRFLEDFNLEPSTPVEDPDPNVNPKSPDTIHGVDSDNDGIRDSYKASVLEKYEHPDIVQLALAVSLEYADLHTLGLEEAETIEISKEDATTKYNSIVAFEKCAQQLQSEGRIDETPAQLYANSIYRALYYRLGKERLFKAMDYDFDALVLPENPCPQTLNSESN